MNVINEIIRINEEELKKGYVNTPATWHSKYANSAWIYMGNLPHELTEGDVLCVMSQWGEIDDINLVRDEDTGKFRGFGFLKYQDARSCILAVDNFAGIKILGRSIRVDHVENYRLPKHLQQEEDNEVKHGHAYQGMELSNSFTIHDGHDLFAPPPKMETTTDRHKREKEKRRERKKEHRRKRSRRRDNDEEYSDEDRKRHDRKRKKKSSKRRRRYDSMSSHSTTSR